MYVLLTAPPTVFTAGRQRAGYNRRGWATVPLDPALLLPAAQRPGAGRKGVCRPFSYIRNRPTSCAEGYIQSSEWRGSSAVPWSAWSQGEVQSRLFLVSQTETFPPLSQWPINIYLIRLKAQLTLIKTTHFTLTGIKQSWEFGVYLPRWDNVSFTYIPVSHTVWVGFYSSTYQNIRLSQTLFI